jgi:membrane protease YdiL (CAAX protease family)
MGPLMLAGPFISGLVMTYIVDGRGGLRALFSRMFLWQVNFCWYAAALFTFPLLIFGTLSILSIVISQAFTPNWLAFGILGGLSAGFIEETGWMGFAFPKMEMKWGTWRATIYLALLHGLWHALAGFLGDVGIYGVYWLPRFIAMWLVAMTAMRILLVWIYKNTGSLLLAQLTHASSTGFLVIFDPDTLTPAQGTFWYAIYAVVLWIPAIIVITKYGMTFKRDVK